MPALSGRCRLDLQVRRGIEPSSPIVALLSTGTEVTVVQEAVDARGTPRVRLSAPARGWAGKRPGTLERVGGPEGEAGAAGGAVPLADLSEEEAQDRLEDSLEEEVGHELFRKEERYFPGRQAAAARMQAMAQVRG